MRGKRKPGNHWQDVGRGKTNPETETKTHNICCSWILEYLFSKFYVKQKYLKIYRNNLVFYIIMGKVKFFSMEKNAFSLCPVKQKLK